MPKTGTLPTRWRSDKRWLLDAGLTRLRLMCRLNGVPEPTVTVVRKAAWRVSACAYYRPDIEANRKYRLPEHGPWINICLEHCGRPCSDAVDRNWTWPGNTTDREPFGVVLHELGHHFDWHCSDGKGQYYGDVCVKIHKAASEAGLTSYADENPAEFLAEAFRLFAANPALLKQIRPRTYALLRERWTPVGDEDAWRTPLGTNVPDRIIKALKNKGVRTCT